MALYRETGLLELQIADLTRDQEMFPSIEQVATEMLAKHPDNVPPLIQRWVGDAVNYADV